MTNAARYIRPILLCVALGASSSMLQGCIPLLIGGAAATTGLVAVDRRSVAQQTEDKTIELKIGGELRNAYGVVLLTGDTIGNDVKAKAGEIARKTKGVKSVSDQITVHKETASAGIVGNDIWITSKVMATLATTKDIPSRTITVTTDRGIVYLMGLVTQREGDMAAATTAQIGGVKRVDKLFQIITPAEANRLDTANRLMGGRLGEPAQSAAPVTTPGAGAAPAQGGVQVMPIQ
jgi:osmotically-inducible protein OsmY